MSGNKGDGLKPQESEFDERFSAFEKSVEKESEAPENSIGMNRIKEHEAANPIDISQIPEAIRRKAIKKQEIEAKGSTDDYLNRIDQKDKEKENVETNKKNAPKMTQNTFQQIVQEGKKGLEEKLKIEIKAEEQKRIQQANDIGYVRKTVNYILSSVKLAERYQFDVNDPKVKDDILKTVLNNKTKELDDMVAEHGRVLEIKTTKREKIQDQLDDYKEVIGGFLDLYEEGKSREELLLDEIADLRKTKSDYHAKKATDENAAVLYDDIRQQIRIKEGQLRTVQKGKKKIERKYIGMKSKLESYKDDIKSYEFEEEMCAARKLALEYSRDAIVRILHDEKERESFLQTMELVYTSDKLINQTNDVINVAKDIKSNILDQMSTENEYFTPQPKTKNPDRVTTLLDEIKIQQDEAYRDLKKEVNL